jgi:spoIIIJ-associated protein
MSASAHSADEFEPEDALRELLEEIVDSLGLDAGVEVRQSEGALVGTVQGEGLGLFIGRRAQTIDAVQHLAQRIVYPGGRGELRVVVDADGYRARRAASLQSEATQAAEEALRSGRPVELDPMPASERRTVHEFLRDRGDVETYSEGDEPDRYLVVAPLER